MVDGITAYLVERLIYHDNESIGVRPRSGQGYTEKCPLRAFYRSYHQRQRRL